MTNKQDKNLIADVAVLKEQMNEIKTNHLVHLSTKMDNLDTKVDSLKDVILDKISNLKLGIAPWVSYLVIPLVTALTLFFLTHKWN